MRVITERTIVASRFVPSQSRDYNREAAKVVTRKSLITASVTALRLLAVSKREINGLKEAMCHMLIIAVRVILKVFW